MGCVVAVIGAVAWVGTAACGAADATDLGGTQPAGEQVIEFFEAHPKP
jgi:hypothetical protein